MPLPAPSAPRITGRFWATCYTDASFTPKAAGWAVWLRSAGGRIVRGGPCPAYVKCSTGAEMAAIFAGIYLARRAWGDALRGVLVYTDSQEAIRHLGDAELRPRIQRKHPGIVRLRGKIRELLAEHQIEIDLRWVKGHQKVETTRTYLNDACDRLADNARAQAERSRRAKAKAKGRPPTKPAPRPHRL